MNRVGKKVHSLWQGNSGNIGPIQVLPEFSCRSRAQQLSLLSFSFLCINWGVKHCLPS